MECNLSKRYIQETISGIKSLGELVTSILAIGGLTVILLYLFWPNGARWVERSFNTDRHWFFMGIYSGYDQQQINMCEENPTRNDITLSAYERPRFWTGARCQPLLVHPDGRVRSGQAAIALNRSYTVGRSSPGASHPITTTIPYGNCVYIIDSVISDQVQKTVWVRAIVGCWLVTLSQ